MSRRPERAAPHPAVPAPARKASRTLLSAGGTGATVEPATRMRPDRVDGMTHQVYAFEPPERFVPGPWSARRAGCLPPGARRRPLSASREKVRCPAAKKLDELLGEAHRRFGVALPEEELKPPQRAAGVPGPTRSSGGHAGLAFDVTPPGGHPSESRPAETEEERRR